MTIQFIYIYLASHAFTAVSVAVLVKFRTPKIFQKFGQELGGGHSLAPQKN